MTARTLILNGPEETTALGQSLSQILCPRDVLLLSGPIGAGKSHLARALIQHRMAQDDHVEDVPSPTFTLVQTYDLPSGTIWHADLYRLTSPAEVFELGLDEAFESAISLIEWPDRLGSDAPADALSITLTAIQDGNARQVTLSPPNALWDKRLKAIL